MSEMEGGGRVGGWVVVQALLGSLSCEEGPLNVCGFLVSEMF